MSLDRRQFLTSSALTGATAVLAPGARAAAGEAGAGGARAGEGGAAVHWLDGASPLRDEGQSWGQPWPRGTRYNRSGYALLTDSGAVVPLQTWPMAWWPDGSVKWTGHAAPAGVAIGAGGVVRAGLKARPAGAVAVAETAGDIRVTSAGVVWTIGRTGPALVRSAAIGGAEVLRDVALLATAQDGDCGLLRGKLRG